MQIDRWQADRIVSKTTARVAAGVRAATIALASDVKRALSVPGSMLGNQTEHAAAVERGFTDQFHKNRAYVKRKGKRVRATIVGGKVYIKK